MAREAYQEHISFVHTVIARIAAKQEALTIVGNNEVAMPVLKEVIPEVLGLEGLPPRSYSDYVMDMQQLAMFYKLGDKELEELKGMIPELTK